MRKLPEGGKPLSAELDKAVLDFMLEERTMGRLVTNKGMHLWGCVCAGDLSYYRLYTLPAIFALSSSYRWGAYWRYFTVYNYIYNYIYILSLQGLSRAVNNCFVN